MYMALGNDWIVQQYPTIDIIMGMSPVVVRKQDLTQPQHPPSNNEDGMEGTRSNILNNHKIKDSNNKQIN
jgi:hypothetical protein